MLNRLVEHAPTCQVRSYGTAFPLGAVAAGGLVFDGTSGLNLDWITVVILILVVIVVPAVWSTRGYRRKAGLDVLALILSKRE